MSMQFRSSDVFLGLPYDIILGALFLTNIAKHLELKPATLSLNLADAHVYENHFLQVDKYIANPIHNLPILKNNKLTYFKQEAYIPAKLNN